MEIERKRNRTDLFHSLHELSRANVELIAEYIMQINVVLFPFFFQLQKDFPHIKTDSVPYRTVFLFLFLCTR